MSPPPRGPLLDRPAVPASSLAERMAAAAGLLLVARGLLIGAGSAAVLLTVSLVDHLAARARLISAGSFGPLGCRHGSPRFIFARLTRARRTRDAA
jgi:hypothetical protein